ncbi:MAG: ribosome assembly RNA-binding protein YhbY [Clostridia bacterium]
MISSKQRAYLRSLTHNLSPMLHIGKDLISENLIKQADDYLEANELMKVTVMQSVEEEINEIANNLANKVDAEIVQVIGRKFTLYRKSENNPVIILPKN